MKNALNWFEIPVGDIDRAVDCYETLLGAKLRREVFGTLPYGVFPFGPPGIGGALVQDPRRPSRSGTLVYLNADGQLDAILARIEQARASIVLPKTFIGKEGFIAIVADSEGNHVGLNSST
ncbi:MAG: VOC family protein [Myxococcota bacterium]|nr:VOC family protein [Myxococcota bacterium]